MNAEGRKDEAAGRTKTVRKGLPRRGVLPSTGVSYNDLRDRSVTVLSTRRTRDRFGPAMKKKKLFRERGRVNGYPVVEHSPRDGSITFL